MPNQHSPAPEAPNAGANRRLGEPMDAVLLACLAGAFFGILSVAVRYGLAAGGDPESGAVVSSGTGFVLALVVAAGAGVDASDFDPAAIWPFILAGAVVPGLAQVIFVRAVRDAGPSRTAVLIGTAPLLSALLALALLDEPFSIGLALGTVLVVGGAAALAGERSRPAHFRIVGAVLALLCAALFALRDNAVRWAAVDTDVSPFLAAAVSLGAAWLAGVVYLLVVRGGVRRVSARLTRRLVWFLPAGVCLGIAYVALLEAFDRGKVTIVAPLNGTQSLWAVVFSAILLHRTEAVGRRLVLAALLVVAGGALIGVSR